MFYSSYAGGMYAASDNPRLIPADCCTAIFNGTVRSGFIDPRPSIQGARIAWLDIPAQHSFENGIYQGSRFYNSERGPVMLYAFDGHIIALDLRNMEARCLTTAKRPFSKRSQFVYFEQRGPYALAQDGISPPVVIRGNAAKQGTKSTGVPCGRMMVDGWGMLAVVSPCRRRIKFSNHEVDPNSKSILDFTQATAYFKNARYIEVPASLGKIVAIDYAPSFYGKADLGPLIVFCERGTRAYDVSVPRESWATQDIATTPLPSFGSCAHKSVVRRGNDLVFSDQEGRIQTMKAAMRRDEDSRMNIIDAAVWPIYKNEHASLRAWRQCVRFDDRILTTILPRRVKRADGSWSVTHSALAAYQEDPSPTNQDDVWDGIWTGLGFTALDTCTYDGQEQCLIVSTDVDGVNRLYELTAAVTGYDVGSELQLIPMTAALHPSDMEAPLLTKSYSGCAIRLGKVQGKVALSGQWTADRASSHPWFEDRKNVPFATCSKAALNQPMPRINPPAPPKAGSKFFECQPVLTIKGMARLEEVGIETSEPAPVPNKMNTSCKLKLIPADTNCQPTPFDYAIAS